MTTPYRAKPVEQVRPDTKRRAPKLYESGLVSAPFFWTHPALRFTATTVKGELKMKAQSVNDNSRKPYNNVPLREGEVLVPMMVTREFAIGQGADPANLRTWTKSGVQFLVMFTAVPADQEQICQQNFDKAVNQMLDERIGPILYWSIRFC